MTDSKRTAVQRTDVRTDDPGHALHIAGEVYYPHHYRSVGRDQFAMSLTSVTRGEFTVGPLEFRGGVRLRTVPLDAYHVSVPLVEPFVWRRDNGERLAARVGEALIHPPGEHADVQFASGGTVLCVSLRSELVARHARQSRPGRSGRSGRSALPELAPHLDVTRGPAAAWWALAAPLRDPHTAAQILDNPAVAEPFVEAVTQALLAAAGPEPEQVIPASADYVRQAVELIEAEPATPWTVNALAAAVCIGPRALQAGFRRYLDATPLTYLASVRLDRARRDLTRGEVTSVTEAAQRWGFTHLSRFAQAYTERFGEAPSATLRQATKG